MAPHMNPAAAAVIAGTIATIVVALFRRGGRAAPSHGHGHGGGWLVVAGLFALGAAVWANPNKVHKVAAKPPPPPVTKITNTVIKYVPAPAGHPLLSGWALVLAIGIAAVVVLGVAAFFVQGIRHWRG